MSEARTRSAARETRPLDELLKSTAGLPGGAAISGGCPIRRPIHRLGSSFCFPDLDGSAEIEARSRQGCVLMTDPSSSNRTGLVGKIRSGRPRGSFRFNPRCEAMSTSSDGAFFRAARKYTGMCWLNRANSMTTQGFSIEAASRLAAKKIRARLVTPIIQEGGGSGKRHQDGSRLTSGTHLAAHQAGRASDRVIATALQPGPPSPSRAVQPRGSQPPKRSRCRPD